MKKTDPLELARHLQLAPHPEGGFYRETYRAPGLIAAAALPSGFEQPRNYSTAILYLLPEGHKSRWHRLRQDEVWHHYQGGPLRLALISPEGKFEEIILGPEIFSGQTPQFAVPAGTWFGASPRPGAVYSLMGCTVAPGFDFADFEMASIPELRQAFPSLCGAISEWA